MSWSRESPGETLALRVYQQTNLTAKTAVVAYRDEPDGFVSTAWLTFQAGPGAGKRSACMEAITIDRKLIPLLLQLPSHQPWIDYDAEGTSCIFSFEKPQQANGQRDGRGRQCLPLPG